MAATVEEAGTTIRISTLHHDIVETHILTRLDGPTLASASCASVAINALSTHHYLWSSICHSTWPSTSAPRVSDIISHFPGGGPRSFFSQSFSLPCYRPTSRNPKRSSSTPELISAVDIYYRNELIFTKVEETETVSGWFRCSPFRIDLLDPKTWFRPEIAAIVTNLQIFHNGVDFIVLPTRGCFVAFGMSGRRVLVNPDSSAYQVLSAKSYPVRGFLNARLRQFPSFAWSRIRTSQDSDQKIHCCMFEHETTVDI